MERPHKYDRENKDNDDHNDDDDDDDDSERTEPSVMNYIRTSRVLSMLTPNHNSDQSVTTDNEDDSPIDIFLTKEVYEAVEDLSFIANQMRSACHYEEVFSEGKKLT
jgi:hypothetical protein